jgi:hypothetical protein
MALRLLLVGLLCAIAAPSASASTWATTQLPHIAEKSYLHGMACPSPTLCVAVGSNNLIASSTNPAGGPAAWEVGYAGEGPFPDSENLPFGDIAGRQIAGVSCPSPALCVAVTGDGDAYTTTEPGGSASAWAVADLDGVGQGKGVPGPNMHLTAVSCPSVSLCVAVSGRPNNKSGRILTSSNPTAGATSWRTAQLDPSLDLRGVSCGSPSLCVAVSNDGRIVTSTNPAGGPSSWSVVGVPGGAGAIHGIACVAEIFCVAGNEGGNLFASANPTGGLASWRQTSGGASVQITAVSCLPDSRCLAVDNNGDVLTSNDPTADEARWTFLNVVPYTLAEGNAMFGAACPASTLCVVAGARGRIYTSGDPFTEPRRKKKRLRGPKRPKARIAEMRPSFRRITRGRAVVARYRFFSSAKVRGFLCQVDTGPFKRCRSPVRFRAEIGRHVFRVRAIGMTGLGGPIAKRRFEIFKKGPRRTG